ncbi:hypothetical protein D3C81_2232560 [compost metagenome]
MAVTLYRPRPGIARPRQIADVAHVHATRNQCFRQTGNAQRFRTEAGAPVTRAHVSRHTNQ